MPKPRKPGSPRSQRERFIKAAREHGASEDERVFDENLKRIAKGKPIAPDKDVKRRD